ncbi:glycosyltransferase family 2 protein [Cyclobacterium qasimii]|uniref:B-glycosyltransferase, glycosyltransferase family 2 protein n=2 Tax=Cyclobacterium qasimii TaxID=1350429 RepID=S7V779_9BACT|nr:glycosyltransferase family 2 protein [Cyclobacterium qasimii]EPR65761.1 b-glycosyltransferase, glycosyltransferase family 2 protein [Cyclobacterium qasimii M12-11B]GEO20744.1 glycosyl transferase [Cyclobacterium qasimii]
MNQKISIITVCYNCVNDISLTIESVLSQSYPEIQFIVIDGGSTDGTLEVINKYSDKIDVFISEPDKGIFDAMNKGLKYVSGEWVNFMNAGDKFYNSSVLHSIFYNKNYNDFGVLYGSTFSNDSIREPTNIKSLNYGGIMACHQSIFYNSIVCGKNLYYKTKHKYYGDIELTRRLYLLKIKFQKTSIVVSCFQGGGFSSQISKEARIAKFDYLYQNMGFIGIINGVFGKIIYLFKN